MPRPHTLVFLPCRAGSIRVPEKNTRAFCGLEHGLLGIKLDQLERLPGVDCVVLDSNDPVVLRYGEGRRRRWRGRSELVVVERPDELGQSATTTDALILYALNTVSCDLLVWTHVTSPLFDENAYERGLRLYQGQDSERYDSLMSVRRVQSFCWNADGPVNYSREPVRWPRTQDLQPVFEINSGMFVVALELGRSLGDRIGHRPMLFEVEHDTGFDVDTEEDFRLAELLYASRVAEHSILPGSGGHPPRDPAPLLDEPTQAYG